MKTRFLLSVALLVSLSAYGLAQNQNGQFHVKRQAPDKAPKKTASVPMPGAHTASASSTNAKDLQTIERQSAKSAPAHSQKTNTAFKPVKDKPTPPMNFNGSGGAKSPGMTNQGTNPYKGRLRQKHTGNQNH